MDPTRRVQLGRTKLRVSQLGFGSVPIGGSFGPVAEAEASSTVERAYDLGVRLFDTAPLYGRGLAERRLGQVLGAKPRDEFVLSTKVGRLLVSAGSAGGAGDVAASANQEPEVVFDFSYDGVMRSVEESLTRLGLDRVDMLLIHDPDDHYEQALSGAYVALDKLRREGVVAAIGAGMNQAEMLARFAREADFDCFLCAGRYTLLDHAALKELLPVCVEKQISIIIGGVYNSGILTDPRPGALFNYKPAEPDWLGRAQRLKAVCDRHNTPLKAAAIQFPAAHPAIATVLTGVRSVAELEENERMFRFEIPADLWRDLRAEGLLPEAAPVPGDARA
jgi:D-threo-aldose 1-dehydrogenase